MKVQLSGIVSRALLELLELLMKSSIMGLSPSKFQKSSGGTGTRTAYF